MSEFVKDVYCYSRDGETYLGNFSTREDALDNAVAELDYEPGQTLTVWTGMLQPAIRFLFRYAEQIGIDFAEHIDEWLSDKIVADNPTVDIRDPDVFGVALVELLEEHATFTSFIVTNIKEHEVTIPIKAEKS